MHDADSFKQSGKTKTQPHFSKSARNKKPSPSDDDEGLERERSGKLSAYLSLVVLKSPASLSQQAGSLRLRAW